MDPNLICERYGDLAKRMAIAFVSKNLDLRIDAADAMQEGYVGLLELAGQVDTLPDEPFVVTVIKNKLSKLSRKERRHVRVEIETEGETVRVPLVSLDEPIGESEDGDPITIGDTIASPQLNPEEQAIKQELTGKAIGILQRFREPVRRTIAMHCGLEGDDTGRPMSFREIAAELNRSKSDVARLYQSGLSLLRALIDLVNIPAVQDYSPEPTYHGMTPTMLLGLNVWLSAVAENPAWRETHKANADFWAACAALKPQRAAEITQKEAVTLLKQLTAAVWGDE